MESQMTKHEPGLWAELNEYISDIRSSLKLDSLAMACEPSRPLLWTNHHTARKSTCKYAGGEDIGLLVRFVPELRQRLGAHRAPRRVIQITDALPRTGSEKLDRQRVVEMWRSLVSH